MQTVGIITVVLFLAALVSFVMGFYNPDKVQIGASLGVLFLAVACILLAVTIKKRNKTERI